MNKIWRSWLISLLVALLACLVGMSVVYFTARQDENVARSQALADASDRGNAVRVAMDRALSSTYALAAMVRQGRGQLDDFDTFARPLIIYYPGVMSLQLAPAGVVQQIYPLKGNEKAIGHNLLADPARNKEAFMARDTGQMTLAGPFPLLQGGIGAVGRLPIFIGRDNSGKPRFWGFAIALVRFPDVLHGAGLDWLPQRGYQYRLWRLHPDTRQVQIIAGADSGSKALGDPVHYYINMPNGVWTLDVQPQGGWRDQHRIVINSALVLVISFLLGWLAWQMLELRRHRAELALLVALRTRALAQETSDRQAAEHAALAETMRQAALLQTAADGIHILDEHGQLTEFSDSFASMLGYAPDEMRQRQWQLSDWNDAVPSGLLEQLLQDESGQGYRFETRHRCKDGSQIEVEVNAKAMDIGGRRYLYASSRDISERKHAEQLLRIAATAFEAQEGMVVTDCHTVILRVNSAFSKITGYPAEDVVGRKISILQSGRHDAAFYRRLWLSLREQGVWQGEIWNRRKNGEIYPEWLSISAVLGDNGEVSHYVGTMSDITQRKAAEDKIKRLAFYDPLTQLPNRRLLLDRLQVALDNSARNQQTGALLFIDLDNFKTLNDTLGHDMGDRLLQEVAVRLNDCLRSGDTVARLGGDEFVVMLERLSPQQQQAAQQTRELGQRILDSLARPYPMLEGTHHNTCSLGAVLFFGNTTTVEELLKRADLAMYQAKGAGRNTLRFFDPEMQQAVTARAELEADLRRGLQQQEFQLFYQPQVDADGRITGAEALLRWQRPEYGLVTPASFIPLAEESGLIVPLGEWVLHTACRQLAAWAADSATAQLELSVNVSARQFHQPGFVAMVRMALQQSGAPARQLKLELTESLLLQDVDDTVRKMQALKQDGVGFSLDDFGTGYSSLSYIKRLPLDQLKIDQSFVRDIDSNVNDVSIIRTIVALAGSMQLQVIAEGVETASQRQFLLQQHCRAFQGYLFGKPMSIGHFMRLLASR
ncbi:bifunctional diguanylate cyclase/phosphodiesterase [Aquitalea aquatilis]|uniref:bifunctional diguanylate cyclase/phosphodiesterase n=1 Tax=Aquitalea aquatilis TaxID=1537400 RepID=UPI0010BCF0D3|nr:EAL domain-containing protein [Aquitalea aquatilis]